MRPDPVSKPELLLCFLYAPDAQIRFSMTADNPAWQATWDITAVIGVGPLAQKRLEEGKERIFLNQC
jgi:hypothetical protein